ncbi:MAG TPA: AAA family ATPase [Mycobacteriales bacterium]|nr:AAA family ATPase [Mycobacteriales bacterium]
MASRQPGAPIRRITVDSGAAEQNRWPYTLPVVKQVAAEGLALDPGVNVLVGANGSGKSTLVEAVAAAWARRITAFRQDWLQRAVGTPSAEDSDLHGSIRLEYTKGGATGGLFLRAERIHAQAAGIGSSGRWEERIGQSILSQSHGEGFLEILRGMTAEPGCYILDEPESALSLDSCLALLAIMSEMRAAGSQIILATHSPILASLPGARILELSESGLHSVSFDDTSLVRSWRAFLEAPERYHKHLI